MTRATVVRAAVGALVATAVAIPVAQGIASTANGDGGLNIVSTWSPFPADTSSPGAVIPDPTIHVGLALSDNSTTPDQIWSRAQLVSLSAGKSLGAPVPIPTFRVQPAYAPHWLDVRRHLFVYATPETTVPAPSPNTWDLVGVSLTGSRPKVVFQVPSRFPFEGIEAIGADRTGNYLMVVASADRASTGSALASGSGVDVDVASIAGLLHGKFSSPWSGAYAVSKTACPALIETSHAPQILWTRDRVYLGCHQANAFGTSLVTVNRTPSGVVELSGLGISRAAAVTTSVFSAPGNYESSGEAVADTADNRLVLIDSSYGIGARVFDATHDRYVGRTPLGYQIPSGYAVDNATGRFYVGTDDATVGLADPDLRALVPTQGLRVPEPWAAIFQQNVHLMFGLDASARTLYIPAANPGLSHPYQVLVVRDMTAPFVRQPAVNPDAGALDVPEQPGFTDSQRSVSAQGYGADYQLIGGIADLQQNTAGDQGATQRPGSNFLRQAEVQSATLSSDESTAQAVTGREDDVTDGLRQGVPNGGNQFAPAVSCSDFGTSPTAKPSTAFTAFVDCNYAQSRTHTGASFVADGGVFITTTGANAPAASPVQVSSSAIDVTESRASRLGAVTTTVTSTASGVELPGGVRIGAVTSLIKLSTHGRHGTATASRSVILHDVSIGSTAVCTAACSVATAESAIEQAVPSRVHVEFPAAQVDASPGGTYAEVLQDPWFHAERVLDADKADTDVAVPAMTVTVNLDGKTKSRLVVDLAAGAASSSYRIFRLDQGGAASSVAGKSTQAQPLQVPAGLTTGTTPVTSPVASTPQVASGGFVPTLAKAASIVLGSFGRLLELLPVFLLLGVPVYLSARRRLLLELPLLGREEETL